MQGANRSEGKGGGAAAGTALTCNEGNIFQTFPTLFYQALE
jgi:hypothetical protein